MEVSRIFFQAPLRKLLILSFSIAGLFAHTVYLILQTELQLGWSGLWFGSWSGWCLAGAWVLMTAYIWVFLRQPQTVLGIFILPVVIGLTLIGSLFVSTGTFTPVQARTIWRMIHGAALLFGTVTVALGFVFGLAYLIHARRLKLKLPHSKMFRLPSLEWLQQASERALLTSAGLLAVGLVSGVVINLIQARINQETSIGQVAWSDPVIWTSLILFLWLLAASIFSRVYQPARQGRKVAYLVIASFLFLVLELGLVWWIGHGQALDTEMDARVNIDFVNNTGGFDR